MHLIAKEGNQANFQDNMPTLRNLIIFTIAVLGIAIIAAVIEPFTVPPGADAGASGLGRLLWIVTPLVVLLLLRTFGGGGWRDIGLKPNFSGNGFWWLVSILIFPVVLAMTVVLGVIFGGTEFDVTVLPVFGSALLTGLISALAKNLFEELAWRGYLAPKVYSLGLNIWLSHAILGIVWGAWHLPFVYVFWLYLTANMLWYFIPLLLLGTISQSVVYGEIRLATDSVLPAWVMHTIGNAIGNTLLLSGLIQIGARQELLFSPGAESVCNI